MKDELDFRDICKLVKSTEDYTISYDPDGTGLKYFGGGFEIVTKVNNKDYTWDFDMFPIYEDDYLDGWDVAKTYFESLIIETDDFYTYMHDVYDLNENNELYQELKSKMLKACNVIINQIEAISKEKDFDLDSYFRKDDYDEN